MGVQTSGARDSVAVAVAVVRRDTALALEGGELALAFVVPGVLCAIRLILGGAVSGRWCV